MINSPRVRTGLSLFMASSAFWGFLTVQQSKAQEDLAGELPRIPAVEPDKALSTFAIRPGFRLVPSATEPLVADPVSMVYDGLGRAYVVEMRGYPFPEEKPTGKVRLLEDTNSDGIFDKLSNEEVAECVWMSVKDSEITIGTPD